MKRSNKILTGTLLFVVTVIVLHYVALYAMYKLNWYSQKIDYRNDGIKSVYPGSFSVMHVKGFSNVVLLMGDSFHYEIDSLPDEFFKEEKSPDTLLLRGDTFHIDTTRRGIDTLIDHYGQELRIYITGREYIELDRCEAEIYPTKIMGNMNVHLYSTELLIIPAVQRDEEHTLRQASDSVYRFNMLSVDADHNSKISLRWNVVIEHFKISLADYCSIENIRGIESNNGEILQGTLEYSDYSDISLSGDQLKNLLLIYKKKESPQPGVRTSADSFIYH